MSQANYSLRLQTSIKKEAEQLAKEQGTTLNQFINVAVAEKVSVLRTIDYLKKRGEKGDVSKALEILWAAGDEPPRAGDEVEPI